MIPELPFEHFLTYGEVTDYVQALAAACPERVTAGRLGVSRDGRDIPLLTITDPSTGPAADKPAYLIHGNIHAAELSGTHAALYSAQKLAEAGPECARLLREIAFYIVPRLNPDGAEFVVQTSGSCRSRTDRSERLANTLYQEDVNGDGLILTMRQEHPDGSLAPDPEDPRLLIRRTHTSKGPFYRTFPEGLIHRHDGNERVAVEGRSFDWNRNWSYDWRPEPEQGGAGDFPFSEPEMRSMAEFIHGHGSLFAILGYHNGPNGMLRPPSTGSDYDLDGGDVALMHELAGLGSKATGFPIVPVVKYHLNRPGVRDVNLRGHFHNFGYQHLGLFVFEFELGTQVNSAGIPTEEVFATQTQAEYEALLRRVLHWWDEQGRTYPLFKDWERFEHPQLGAVEIGGFLPRHMAGPTLPELRRIAADTYRFTLEHAAYHPRVVAEDLAVEEVGEGICRVRLRIANRGQFPTHVSNRGRNLARLRPVRVELELAKGVELLSREGHRTLGHLGGLTDSRLLEWFLKAPDATPALGTVTVHGGTGGRSQVCLQGASQKA